MNTSISTSGAPEIVPMELVDELREQYTALLESQVDEVLERFNFDSVHAAMIAMNWTWYGSDGVPNVDELRATATRLLEDTIVHYRDGYDLPENSSGGFSARVVRFDTRGRPHLSLAFVVTETTAYSDM